MRSLRNNRIHLSSKGRGNGKHFEDDPLRRSILWRCSLLLWQMRTHQVCTFPLSQSLLSHLWRSLLCKTYHRYVFQADSLSSSPLCLYHCLRTTSLFLQIALFSTAFFKRLIRSFPVFSTTSITSVILCLILSVFYTPLGVT